MYKRKPVDVILQNNIDGSIIPLKLRIRGEDGEQYECKVIGYIDLSGQGARTFADGVYVSNRNLVYKCKLLVEDKERIVNLYHIPSISAWFITTGG